MEILNDQQWRLKALNIQFMEYGEYRGKYVGKIEFANKQNEAFTFNISEEKANQFLALIRDSVVDSAHHLGDRILQSMPFLPAPAAQTAIEDISHS